MTSNSKVELQGVGGQDRGASKLGAGLYSG
jgi:hypothetical protein